MFDTFCSAVRSGQWASGRRRGPDTGEPSSSFLPAGKARENHLSPVCLHGVATRIVCIYSRHMPIGTYVCVACIFGAYRGGSPGEA